MNNIENVKRLVRKMKENKVKNIVVLIGAGVSTSCGIPDFRTKDTGAYDIIRRKYGMRQPEMLFQIDYFKRNPAPFFEFRRPIFKCMEKAKPSFAHNFIKRLADKRLLKRLYTQNTDGLELKTGIDPELVVQAHGSYATFTCQGCGYKCRYEDIKEVLLQEGENVPVCPNKKEGNDCVIKPDNVMFGESMPERFFKHQKEDFEACDMLIVMGTSLKVYPFAILADLPKRADCLKLLINFELAGLFVHEDEGSYTYLGECDDGCRLLEAELVAGLDK